jgi:hypothetical protein
MEGLGPLIHDPAIHVVYRFIIMGNLIKATGGESNSCNAPVPLRLGRFANEPLGFYKNNPPSSA